MKRINRTHIFFLLFSSIISAILIYEGVFLSFRTMQEATEVMGFIISFKRKPIIEMSTNHFALEVKVKFDVFINDKPTCLTGNISVVNAKLIKEIEQREIRYLSLVYNHPAYIDELHLKDRIFSFNTALSRLFLSVGILLAIAVFISIAVIRKRKSIGSNL